MAWGTRPTGRRYYYRRFKRNGRVISEYVGGGPTAALIARLDSIEREEREERRRALRKEQSEQAALDGQIDELGNQVQELVTAVLLANGYHTHKREWRRTRGRQTNGDH
jgi:hypothetical protein